MTYMYGNVFISMSSLEHKRVQVHPFATSIQNNKPTVQHFLQQNTGYQAGHTNSTGYKIYRQSNNINIKKKSLTGKQEEIDRSGTIRTSRP